MIPFKAMPIAKPKVVVTYAQGASTKERGHEASTLDEIARRLAALIGSEYAGEYDPQKRYEAQPYFVPSHTLTSDLALNLGIHSEDDLFGGVVPHAFVATKSITHPLFPGRAVAPEGWRGEFADRVAHVVLEGFSAFTVEDALLAGRRLLENGQVRIKPGAGIAGLGQFTADNATDLIRALETLDQAELGRTGLVIEQNLLDVMTYSVGTTRVGNAVCTYYGTQSLTRNRLGHEVYGGSSICVVKGDFDALLDLELSEEVRLAITQARTYDNAADECFQGFYASRRNYDIAQGCDSSGREVSGVLEQSWRLGGASGAEIAALEAFRAAPELQRVHANTCEVHGDAPRLPDDAAIYFSGNDPHLGPLTKFAWTKPNANSQ